MGLLSFIPLIGKVVDKVLDIVDEAVPDKDMANKIKLRIREVILVQQHEEIMAELEGQVKIILAEAQGSWLQRNWRPILMLSIVAIVVNNYLLYPYLNLLGFKAVILDLPEKLWNLMTAGVGGYIVGRSAEKIAQTFKGGK